MLANRSVPTVAVLVFAGVAAAQTGSNRVVNQCDGPDGRNSSGHQADNQQEKQKLNAHRFCREGVLQVSKGQYSLV